MTVLDMCKKAALLSERDDEFVPDDSGKYVEEAARYREIFIDAFNEAQSEVARKLGVPIATVTITPENNRVSFADMDPPMIRIRRLEDAEHHSIVGYVTITEGLIEVCGTRPLKVFYNHLPNPMALDTDKPHFPDETADPMLYINLAVARVYQSERKNDTAAPWEARYYEKLRQVKTVGSGKTRRIPKRIFR